MNTDTHYSLRWSLSSGKYSIWTETGWHCDIGDDEDGMTLVKALEMMYVREREATRA